MKNQEGKNIHKKILELFDEYSQLSPLEISRLLNFDYDRIYNLLRNIYKRGEIKRIERGIYSKCSWVL